MKVTIVRVDNSVIIDNEHQEVDCSALPPWLHAIQWDGEKGWIEAVGSPNIPIVDISPYQFLIDAWNLKKEESEQAAMAAAEAAEADKVGTLAPPTRSRTALAPRRIQK